MDVSTRVPVLLVVAAVVGLWPTAAEAPPAAPGRERVTSLSKATAPAGLQPVAVRIEQSFVRVTDWVAEARRPVRATAARVKPEPRLIARARRVLFGDGTHRPEPFPRVQ